MKLYRFETDNDTHCVAARDEVHAREELDFLYVQGGYLTKGEAEKIKPECDNVEYQTWDEFVAKHRPIKTHITQDAPYDGCMFETFGEELDFVRKHAAEQIFTLVEAEGYTFVVPGFHIVNRLGYLLVEQPWTKADEQTTYLTD